MSNYTSIFNQYKTSENIDFLMLNRKIEFPSDMSLDIYDKKMVTDNIPWTILSYQLYDSISYWWILAKLNPSSIFFAKEGSTIFYLKKKYLKEVLNFIGIDDE